MATRTKKKSGSRRATSRSVRLKPANSFDLIRFIAHSQSGTRKAIAELVETLSGRNPDAGIPEPGRVIDSDGNGPSRMAGRTWEYNAAHPDYRAVVDNSKLRLRYLVNLFAKEVVLRNYGEPRDEALLEKLVEVPTHLNLKV